MRKEVVIAIILGAALGLSLAFAIWRANQALAPEKLQTEQKQISPSPVLSDTSETGTTELVVTAPENGIVVNTDTVLVRGTAVSGATIVIISNTGEIILEAGRDGSFDQSVKLEGGANQIKVEAYDSEGNKAEKIITVVYSTEFPPKETDETETEN